VSGPEPSTTSASAEANRTEPLVELKGVNKFFGGVRALADVDLTVRRGEVLALVGDNGAGKSTLVKIISGTLHAESGEMFVEGQEVRMESSRHAVDLGIHTVYQDLSLCDNLDVVRNLFLGQERTSGVLSGKRLKRREMEDEARRVLGSLSVKLKSLDSPVGKLSGGQRQGIAICRALVTKPKLVMLDEPTAALGIAQRTEVLGLIGRLRDQDCGVIVISHDLRDVQLVADRVVVLRQGRTVAQFVRGAYSSDDLVAAITGSHDFVAG
jgi:D-xylose transport system ATP-binding protein